MKGIRKRLLNILLIIGLCAAVLWTNGVPALAETTSSYLPYERVAGSSRYYTAAAVADKMKEALGIDKFDAVIVTTGEDYTDALSSAYLAKQHNAPILLIKDAAAQYTASYIRDNLKSGGTIYLVNGAGAVSRRSEDALSTIDAKKVVLAGSDKYESNLAVLNETGAASDLLIASGESFPDCLTASAVGLPLMLVNDRLTEHQLEWIDQHRGINFILIGGESAVSGSVAETLAGYGGVRRVWGENRYETAASVAREFFSSPEKIIVSCGENFPDGLTSGILGLTAGYPVLLVKPGAENTAREYGIANNIDGGYVIGGMDAVSENSAKEVFRRTTDTPEPEVYNYKPYYYSQWDSRWKNKAYYVPKYDDYYTIGSVGCVPTSAAMCIRGITGDSSVTPLAVADYLYNYQNCFCKIEIGSSGMGVVHSANHWGLKHDIVKTQEELVEALEAGKLVTACIGKNPPYTHCIVLYGYSNGYTTVADPNDHKLDGKTSVSSIWNNRSTWYYDCDSGSAFTALYK